MSFKRYLIEGDMKIAEKHQIEFLNDNPQQILDIEVNKLKTALINYKNLHQEESDDIDMYLSKVEKINLDDPNQKFAGYFKDFSFAFWVDSPKLHNNAGFIYLRIFDKERRYQSGIELGTAFNERDIGRMMLGMYFNEFQDFFGMNELQASQVLGYSLGATFN